MSDIIAQAKVLLKSKHVAYIRTFDTESVDVQIVLKDLAEFCRANSSTFQEDARVHAVLEGRREVWLRIQKYLKLSPDELWDLTRKD
jgi:hypothetical protein